MTQAHYKHLLPSEHNGCETARAGDLKARLQAKKTGGLSLFPGEWNYRGVPITELDHEGLLLVAAVLFDRERTRHEKTIGVVLA